jgi:transposase
MTEYKRIGIDTSKAVFTLHGIDQQDRPTLRINLRRAQMIPFFKKSPPLLSPWKPAAVPTIGLTN